MRRVFLGAMPGKDPQRPEGKSSDAEHQRRLTKGQGHPLELPKGNAPDPSRYPAEEQIGGSRPGVPSRMKGESPEDD